MSDAPMNSAARIAIFAATSGHSGVDRILRNLAGQFDTWGIGVDLLRVREHGPAFDSASLRHARLIDLGASHVATAFPGLVRYLRQERPAAMLCDKDRVNRTAILARRLAGSGTRLCVRLGTAVSVNLAERNALERLTQKWSMRHLYPRADRVIVPSAGVKQDLLAFAALPDRLVEVIRSPILTPRLASLAREPIPHPWLEPDQPPVIMGIGELSYRKQFETLVRAFALVRQQHGCRLIILGRGRRRESLLQLATELGVAKDLALPGFQANPYAWLGRARVFVLSSLWEGLPVALIEALGLNVPAVATDCPGGPAEVLTNNDSGTLVPMQDPQAMAKAIRHWLDVRPQAEALAATIAPYRIEESAAAYLRALGIAPPPGLQDRR
jgi:glycosyltransferase involved in cell wall biosynthesis